MDLRELAERIFLNLPFSPNEQQIELIASLAKFCTAENGDNHVFLLNGFAGTGKTSLTGALVKALREARVPVVLLAPTGRAAKVFSALAQWPAYTIHRRIYRPPAAGAGMSFGSVNTNTLTDAVFIVDEASMIGGGPDARENLLEDLVEYVYSGPGCRMILSGDTAQLPPVGTEESPAMSVATLRKLGLRVTKAVMTKVVRQAAKSGILYNATMLRRQMGMGELRMPRLRTAGFDDVGRVSPEDLEDELSAAYDSDGIDETIVITRSNKRATAFNLAIRSRILEREEELCVGERLLVGKNNYFWCSEVKGLSFIANGDVAVVEKVYSTEDKYGLRFGDVKLRLVDRDIALDCKIMLDPLRSESPGLDPVLAEEFGECIFNDPDLFTADTPAGARMAVLKKDPYYNALQVKFAYSVTCHKAQGGQWKNVFVDMAYIAPESAGLPLYRWLYTACTRARGRLMLIAPEDNG